MDYPKNRMPSIMTWTSYKYNTRIQTLKMRFFWKRFFFGKNISLKIPTADMPLLFIHFYFVSGILSPFRLGFFLVSCQFFKLRLPFTVCWFAVFDGHAGSRVSAHCAHHLLDCIRQLVHSSLCSELARLYKVVSAQLTMLRTCQTV